MITIDSREQKRHDLVSHLAKLDFTEFTISDTKRIGESKPYKWPCDIELDQGHRKIGIQRKTISDFVGSLDKLKETMRVGREEWDVFTLLLEGHYELSGDRVSYRRGQYFADSIQSASLHNFEFSQAMRGSPVLYSNNLEESARLITNLHGYSGPEIEAGQRGSQVAMLCQLPNIGEDTAVRLMKYYGSAGLALRQVGEWAEVDGIGAKTVQEVQGVVEP